MNKRFKRFFFFTLFILYLISFPIKFAYDLRKYKLNSFTRTIQIKKRRLKMATLYFWDENNIKYELRDSILFGKYSFISEIIKIKKGNQVTIKGYTTNYIPFGKRYNVVYDIL
uniref:Uncharacterized protein n=1 Tax=viral metagenome TaxID=1070528 RepID=A0A6C0FAK2_9ZZZZ